MSIDNQVITTHKTSTSNGYFLLRRHFYVLTLDIITIGHVAVPEEDIKKRHWICSQAATLGDVSFAFFP